MRGEKEVVVKEDRSLKGVNMEKWRGEECRGVIVEKGEEVGRVGE